MAKRPTITTVSSGFQSNEALNTNLEALRDGFDNTLSLDGSTPNAMAADLDLNSNAVTNASSVTTDALTVAGVNLVSATAVPDWKGAWLTSTVYALNDIVSETGNTYICIIAHTSGTFSTDLTAVKWELFASKGSAGAGTGDMLAANDLSDVADAPTARSNLGLGTAATTASTDYMNRTSPVLGGAVDTNDFMIKESKGADIASATTLTLLADGNYFNVTGTTTIAGISDIGDKGVKIVLNFNSALSLTHSSSFSLITEADIAVKAGDRGTFVMSTNNAGWRMVHFSRADGTALVQTKNRNYTRSTTEFDITTGIPDDDTIPQITEGDQVLSVTITPTSTTANLKISVKIAFGSGNTFAGVALFQNSTASAIASQYVYNSTGTHSVVFDYEFVPASVSLQTFTVRVGPVPSGTVYVNQNHASVSKFGSTIGSSITVEET